MAIDPINQSKSEQNLAWKRSWPSCFLRLIIILETLIGLIIFLTEICNILMDFWHTNIFGGIWTSIIIFINWMLISFTVCCTTTIAASTFALIWNIITLFALGVLIVFDVIFIVNPYTCLLTSTCSTRAQVISLNNIMQLIPPFKHYTSYDSKRFFLRIQVVSASVAFIISLIYIFIFIICRIKLHNRVQNALTPAATAPPPPPLPPPPPPSYHEFPVAQPPPPQPWTSQTAYTPIKPY